VSRLGGAHRKRRGPHPNAQTNQEVIVMRFEKLFATDSSSRNLVLRLVLALVIFPHGAQKLLGWFGGYGFAGTMGYFQSTGMPWVLGFLVIIAEFFGALAIAAGFVTRFAAASVAIVMLGAVAMVHAGQGWFMNWFGQMPAGAEGVEFFFPVVTLAAVLVVEGAGRASVDRAIAARLAETSLRSDGAAAPVAVR